MPGWAFTGCSAAPRKSTRPALTWCRWAAAILSGGIAGPVLLLLGLSHLPASGASLLLNAEGVFTAALALFVFKENFDRRVAAGMLAIIAGAVVISVPAGIELGSIWPSLAILGACLAWGIDNNLTRKIALTDATWLAAVKGLVAGPVNLALAFAAGATLPAAGNHRRRSRGRVLRLRDQPGAVHHRAPPRRHRPGRRLLLHRAVLRRPARRPTRRPPHLARLIIAGSLMALGIWLHLTEQHQHRHRHVEVTHDHWHTHDDEHHLHQHLVGAGAPSGGHKHLHTHQPITHEHEHFPDSHHRHQH